MKIRSRFGRTRMPVDRLKLSVGTGRPPKYRNAGENSGHRKSHRREDQGAGGNRLAKILRRIASRVSRLEFWSYFLCLGLGRKNQGALRTVAGQFDCTTAGGLRCGSGRGSPWFRKNDADETLPGDRRTRQTRRIFSARSDRELKRKHCKTICARIPDALHVCIAGSYRRRKGNCSRP